MGRVGVKVVNGVAYVTWLEDLKDSAAIRLAKVTTAEKLGNSFTIAESSSSRGSGFPQIEFANNQFIFAWTIEEENFSTIKNASIKLDNL